MPEDDPGLLGNLPRSRPGTRSGKRDTSGDGAASEESKTPVKATSNPPKPTPKSTKATSKPAKATAKSPKAAGRGSQTAKTPTKGTPRAQKSPAKGTSPAETAPTGSAKARQVPVSVAEPGAPRSGGGDHRSGPLRSAAKVAGSGLRVAEGVTREVLRRLPRP